MARDLITSWTDYQAAIDRLLPLACHNIRIFDEDGARLGLSSPSHLETLKQLLARGGRDVIRIALRNTGPLRQQPLLMQLLTTYGHLFAAQQTPLELAHLRDGMVLIDDRHALIRFERDLPRGKLLIDEPGELKPYLDRFNEIWDMGGESVGTSTLGL